MKRPNLFRNHVQFLFGLAVFHLWFCAPSQATTFEFESFLVGPINEFAHPDATAVYDDAANTLVVHLLVFGVDDAFLDAPTASPLTGTAGFVLDFPDLHHNPGGLHGAELDRELFDLTQTSTYSPAFLTGNGGTAAGAEAALLSALFGREAYIDVPEGEVGGGPWQIFLVPVPDLANTGLLLSLSLLAIVGLPRLRHVPS